MKEILLKYIGFCRTVLKIEGEYSGETDRIQFYLKNRSSDKKIPVKEYKLEEHGQFILRIPMMAVDQESPLKTGDWLIMAEKKDGSELPAYVTDELYDTIQQYTESEASLNYILDRTDTDYFRAFSRLQKNDFAYYLHVEYHVREREHNIFRIWIENLKIRHRERIHFIRVLLFESFFKIFNRIIPKTGNKVLFTSSSRKTLSGNEEFVYNRMIERGMGEDFRFRFNFKENIKSHRSFKDKVLFTYYLATSDYIFLDDYQPEIYHNVYDPAVKIVQLWHACGAFKTLGFERLEQKGAPPFNTKVHKCYTHIPVSSEHSVRHHAEAFAIDADKFYPIGIPRTDIFFDDSYRKKVTEKLRDLFPQIKQSRKVLLYAPTFRGENARNAYFPMQVLHFRVIGEYLKENNAVMIIKMHPFVREKLDIPERYRECFIDASDYREVNDLLFITDVLITDYSSVIYEMSLLHKPMLFYAFDLKQYEAERGFYEPYKDIVPGKIVKTLPALIEALKQEDFEKEKLQGFVDKNFKYTDGKSTDRVIDLIFGDRYHDR